MEPALKSALFPAPLELSRVRVYPLAKRQSLSRSEDMLVDPEAKPPEVPAATAESIATCARRVREARAKGTGVILMYGAHLVKNGLMQVVNRLVGEGWVTHLATNGAGIIHDWELAFLGRTEESVRTNVTAGCFGTWDETGRAINLAVLAGGVRDQGFGGSIGQFVAEDGVELPVRHALREAICREPAHKLAAARAELLAFMEREDIEGGPCGFAHPNKASSIAHQAYVSKVGMSVHPGIGYDIYATHPWFHGGAIGRAAGVDFGLFSRAVESLDGGVVLSVGSAIMAPQVFEKSLSVVNNLRLQAGREIVRGHNIYVVDIQDGGQWDWAQGEPPKDNPAYYLRFCKSFSRMGGEMRYLQCDNRGFLQQLWRRLAES